MQRQYNWAMIGCGLIAKDFAKADAIRNELLEKGIVLEDTREGVKWHRA